MFMFVFCLGNLSGCAF